MKVYPSPQGDIYVGHIAPGLQHAIESLAPSRVFLIADEHTALYCLPIVDAILKSTTRIIIAPGEPKKTLESCGHIWSVLTTSGADRYSMILNVGGGMICDLGGFAASCYQRGIRFGHIPTSLLAMADASIGGKTGVNFDGFKNYIGRVEFPALTWIDPVFLRTLPYRGLLDGMAELVKHAIIASRELWDLLPGINDLSAVDWNTILDANSPVKQKIVSADPFEKGQRKILNFGHTIGHALESHFLHTAHPLSHGEAITLGMLAESKLANLSGLLENEDFERIIDLIQRLLRPSEVTLPATGALQQWLQGDKKKSGGKTRYSLPDSIGSCKWDILVDERHVVESLNWLGTQAGAASLRLNMDN